MVTVLPLNADAVIAVDDLPTSFHGGPADRMIVATARAHDLPLATHDAAIRKSRLVKLWSA
jgi:PIN domain nuclease of toxin-antitoxin system